MKLAKTILPIAVIALFLTMAFSPAIAEETQPLEEGSTVRLLWLPEQGEPVYEEFYATETQLEQARTLVEALFEDLSTITGPLDPDLEPILTQFKEDFEALFVGIFFPPIGSLLPLLIPSVIRPHGFITVGWGKSVMPFYKWEAFIRFLPLVRPIRVLVYGYTGYWQIFPGISYGDKSHTHYVCARLFQGLFIDGGSLFTERLIGGPVIIFGRAVQQSAIGFR